MPWTQRYRSLVTTAAEAVQSLRGDERVYVGGNAATPRHLLGALAARVGTLPASPPDPTTLSHVLLLGRDPVSQQVGEERIRHRAWFVGPADRASVAEGHSDYVPCHLSEIPRLIRAEAPLDLALLMVAPPDAHGFLSLGTEVMASLAAMEHAKRVIVQVNSRMPRVFGNTFLHLSDVDGIVEAEEELAQLNPPPPSQTDRAIASHILPLIPEGATLQLGIGGIPDAVTRLLEGRDDLGVHSEMISDGVMRAVETRVWSRVGSRPCTAGRSSRPSS